jgi:hypothetical protein
MFVHSSTDEPIFGKWVQDLHRIATGIQLESAFFPRRGERGLSSGETGSTELGSWQIGL